MDPRRAIIVDYAAATLSAVVFTHNDWGEKRDERPSAIFIAVSGVCADGVSVMQELK